MTNPTLRHQGGPVSDLDRLIEHLERTARDMRLRAEGIESALTMARAFRLADTFTEEGR